MSTGLAKGIVRLVDHAPSWSAMYREARVRIERAVGPWLQAIEHVGSTSVPDLIAKPIIDIAARVPAAAPIAELIAALEAAGYIDRGDKGQDGGHLFVFEPEPELRTEHLHIVREGDGLWAIYLGFRDRLRRDPDARRRYAEVKRQLARRFPGDRERYTRGKADFIQSLIADGD